MDRLTGCARTLARILAFVVAAILVFGLPMALLANNTLRVLSSAEALAEIGNTLVTVSGAGEKFAQEMLINIAWEEISDDEKSVMDSLGKQDWDKITQILIPQDWLQAQIRENLEKLLQWLYSEDPAPDFGFDLEYPKSVLKDGGAQRIVGHLIDSWPACSAEQMQQMADALYRDSPKRIPLCRPSDELRGPLLESITLRILGRIEALPSRIPLGGSLNASEAVEKLASFRKQVLVLSFILRLARLLPLFLLGALMTLGIRSWRELGQWWGIPLAAGALLSLLLVIGMHAIGPDLLARALADSEAALMGRELIKQALWTLIASILNRSAFQALLALMLATALFGATWALSSKHRLN